MFVPLHWARGFINAAGDTEAAALALELAKVMGPAALSIRGQVAGTVAARHLGNLFHGAFAAVPAGDGGPEGRSRELALGLIFLLVKKNLLKYTGQVIEAIEQELDTRRGILRAHLEFARDPGPEFAEQLKRSLMAKTGAAEVRLRTGAVPALLAGCRLRIGS
ncbi:MAG: F0F1 ATP synthase subunit delta, partial [Treponema sp.]|nr:F0F1 ATP synthase subunit delta [Treponema sp.]